MTDTQACQVLLGRLLSGVSVNATEIYKVVDNIHADRLRHELISLREQRKWFKSAKEELREYTKLLNNADLVYNRADKLATTAHRRKVAALTEGKPLKMSKHDELYKKAESKYEDALERLAEITEGREDLLVILHPQLDFYKGVGKESVSADKDSMPRLQFPFQEPQEVKISILKSAVEPIETSNEEQIRLDSEANTLKSKLRRLKR